MRATDPPDELDDQDDVIPRHVSEDHRHRGVVQPGPWRVFLSHTSELRDYPKLGASYVDRAERAVSAAGHAIADMADFAAVDQSPASLCIEKVRDCDVYVGIFGLRYGSPVRDRPEVSYTELEFDTATERGLPRLVFLVDGDSSELVGLPARALIDREYGDRQDAFLQRVCDSGLTLQRFRNPDQLALLVERSLHALAKRGTIRPPSAPPPAPVRPAWVWPTAWDFSAYLHEKRAGFVGRSWLFEEVRAWATDTGPVASQALLISADYGVGKSAFLAELITRAREDASAHPRGPGVPIAAHHFCTTEQDATLAPGVFVGGLAAQLAEALPAYRQALEAEEASDRRRWLEDAGQDPARAFDQAVVAPLLAIEAPPTPQLLVVDGLDEAQDPRRQGGPAAGDTIVSLLARYANRLPAWLKVLATSRRRPDVLTPLRQTFRLKDLDGEEARNLICLRTYAEGRCQEATLAGRLARAGLSPEEVAAFLCRKEQSRGKFLYLVRVLRDLESGLLPLADRADLEALPPGMDGFYADAFARRFPSADDYTPAGAILAVLCEQREPMGRRELAALLGCAERAISERLQPVVDLLGVRCVTGERRGAAALDGVQAKEVLYSLGHLSLSQWLSEEDDYGLARAGRFAVDRLAATERLRAWALEAVAAGRAHTWPYLVRHLASHLTEDERPGVVAGLLGELAWLEARLRLAGINALLGDLALATPSPWLRRLERALRQGAHVLSHNAGWTGPEQLASQLLARLADDGAETGRLRGQAEAGLRQAGGARPLATSLEGHEALLRTLPVGFGMQALGALPDGRLACGSFDNTIGLWDPDTSSCTAVLEGHQGTVSALAALPDGRLASGSSDNTLRLWDPTRPDGAPQVLFVADAAITALLAHPTRPLLVAGDGSGRLHWLELAGRATTQRGGQRPAAA